METTPDRIVHGHRWREGKEINEAVQRICVVMSDCNKLSLLKASLICMPIMLQTLAHPMHHPRRFPMLTWLPWIHVFSNFPTLANNQLHQVAVLVVVKPRRTVISLWQTEIRNGFQIYKQFHYRCLYLLKSNSHCIAWSYTLPMSVCVIPFFGVLLVFGRLRHWSCFKFVMADTVWQGARNRSPPLFDCELSVILFSSFAPFL